MWIGENPPCQVKLLVFADKKEGRSPSILVETNFKQKGA